MDIASNKKKIIKRKKLLDNSLFVYVFSDIYIYIYILPSTDRLFRCITTDQCG